MISIRYFDCSICITVWKGSAWFLLYEGGFASASSCARRCAQLNRFSFRRRNAFTVLVFRIRSRKIFFYFQGFSGIIPGRLWRIFSQHRYIFLYPSFISSVHFLSIQKRVGSYFGRSSQLVQYNRTRVTSIRIPKAGWFLVKRHQ